MTKLGHRHHRTDDDAAAAAAQDLELLKAAAQAWHAQSGNPKPTDEFQARRRSSAGHRPTRFKLEAVVAAARPAESNWDFAQSLWDSYEIVTLSKKLEEASFSSESEWVSWPESGRAGKRSRESKSSLRSLLQRSFSSKRFDFALNKET